MIELGIKVHNGQSVVHRDQKDPNMMEVAYMLLELEKAKKELLKFKPGQRIEVKKDGKGTDD